MNTLQGDMSTSVIDVRRLREGSSEPGEVVDGVRRVSASGDDV
jgi:hypothetical protein